ncbi:hypothetical protein EVAR_67311_1 [Eumeta japonica]|uniref:Uncharacterized protein n=1 Tax=Eumeta variegata TaxID=151549 RepID=A0A4C1ZC67_EUMVA|nr:hypothetical protein EVAR_67311_1 [Eumeta japonica]
MLDSKTFHSLLNVAEPNQSLRVPSLSKWTHYITRSVSTDITTTQSSRLSRRRPPRPHRRPRVHRVRAATADTHPQISNWPLCGAAGHELRYASLARACRALKRIGSVSPSRFPTRSSYSATNSYFLF